MATSYYNLYVPCLDVLESIQALGGGDAEEWTLNVWSSKAIDANRRIGLTTGQSIVFVYENEKTYKHKLYIQAIKIWVESQTKYVFLFLSFIYHFIYYNW